jgi:hypothetical protein
MHACTHDACTAGIKRRNVQASLHERNFSATSGFVSVCLIIRGASDPATPRDRHLVRARMSSRADSATVIGTTPEFL